MNEISSVEEILQSKISLEKHFHKKTNKLGWDYTDVLYSFLAVYQTIGNVIPIWPGGNVHRGQYQCYDIPDIYFNDKKIF